MMCWCVCVSRSRTVEFISPTLYDRMGDEYQIEMTQVFIHLYILTPIPSVKLAQFGLAHPPTWITTISRGSEHSAPLT